MPPPPDPPQGILVPEIAALSTCVQVCITVVTCMFRVKLPVQNMAVKTGQIYGFFADAQRLYGIPLHSTVNFSLGAT